MTSHFSVTACYRFVPLDERSLPDLRKELHEFGNARDMKGLTLIAPEGINATVSGSNAAINDWKKMLIARFGDMTFKDSHAEKKVFRRWSVKIKPEIVALKDQNIHPDGTHRHLTPQEWSAMLKEDVVLIDARNSFEVSIGKFQGALDPGTKAFHEFPEHVAKLNIPKDKKVLLYCTGGIRCEKAQLSMEAAGYSNVYQLDGGILKYLEECPNQAFDGECFVFDRRVALDQQLQPSQIYGLCPHCGDPGDIDITCACGEAKKICADCAREESKKTCSKQCRSRFTSARAAA